MKNIFTKMLLIFLIPALGMLFFTGTFVQEKMNILNEMDVEKESIEYLRISEKLLHELQKERGLSAGYLGSNADEFTKELIDQRLKTDQAIAFYKKYIITLSQNNIRLIEQIKKIQNDLFEISELRKDIDLVNMDVFEDIQRYTNINTNIIDSIAMLLANQLSQETFKEIDSLLGLIEIKDLAGVERAILTNVFENPRSYKYNKDIQKYVKHIIQVQDEDIKRFLNQTSIDNTILFYDRIDSTVVSEIQDCRDIFLIDGDISSLKKDSKEWWDIATIRVESLGKVVQEISDKTIFNAEVAVSKAKRSLLFSLVIWIVGIVGFFVSVFLLNNIVRRERISYKSHIKQKQLYNVLSKTNELIIHDYDMDEVFQNVCDIAVNEVDLSLAYIGMLDQDENIKIVASSGKEQLQNYLKNLNLTIKNNKKSQLGLGGQAIVEARNIIIDNVSETDLSLLVDLAKEHELNSAGAYPLVQSNAIVGVLVIYSKEYKFFDTDINGLFERMGGYLSFGLDKAVQKRLHKMYEEELIISAYAFDSQEAMVITDKEANIVKVNNAFTKITGYKRDEILGQNPRILKSDYHDTKFFKKMWEELNKKGRWSGEIYNCHKDGEVYPQKTTITAIKNRNNETTHYIAQFYDISDIKKSEEKLTYQARHDALTGLPNRIVLKDRLSQAIKISKRHKKIGALMFIDLDNFKNINDSLGHDIGDELLKQIANILKSCVREEDSVIRFGGDEFLILISNLSEQISEAKEQASMIAKKVRSKIDTPLYVKDHKLFTSPSIGITFFPTYSIDTNEVIKQADIAMYKAKDAGKNSIEFYSPR